MFYSEYVLAKRYASFDSILDSFSCAYVAYRGPLGKVWLAAHWTKKLSRKEISEANVVEACQNIQQPQVQLALRTSGHLLLGVVKIHDSKQNTLMHDCSEAFGRIKVAPETVKHLCVVTTLFRWYSATIQWRQTLLLPMLLSQCKKSFQSLILSFSTTTRNEYLTFIQLLSPTSTGRSLRTR